MGLESDVVLCPAGESQVYPNTTNTIHPNPPALSALSIHTHYLIDQNGFKYSTLYLSHVHRCLRNQRASAVAYAGTLAVGFIHTSNQSSTNACSVNNLKRRMVKIPALSEEQFEAQLPSQTLSDQNLPNQKESKDATSSHNATIESEPEDDSEVDEEIPPSQCLFCNLNSVTMNTNLEHMYSAHGLFIPEHDQLSDMETFLGYLASIIFEYNECLYCGAEKSSVEGVQTHMKDKGHCMINLDGKSKLMDFWDFRDSEDENVDTDNTNANGGILHRSATERRLPSGSIISSRADTAQLRAKPVLTKSRNKSSQFRIKRDATKTITDGGIGKGKESNDRSRRTQLGSDSRVAVRGEMGLVGLPEHEKRVLMVTEKKMKKQEAVAKAAQRWSMEKVSNKQKYFKVHAKLLYVRIKMTNF
jgi:pre-60S factor REI1